MIIDNEFLLKAFAVILIAACVIFLLYALLLDAAPEGYEDSDGFHYGEPEKK